MRHWKRSLVLPVTMVAVALGFLISLQVQTQKNVTSAQELNEQRLAGTKVILANAQDENMRLKEEHDRLTAEMDQARQQGGTDPGVLAQLDQMRIMDGTQAVQGPGIHITIDDRQQEHKVVLPLTTEQLTDSVNILRLAGAEAISINGQRIVATTSIVMSGGSTILVNQVPINRVEGVPYEIDAIGNQDVLYDYFYNLEANALKQGGMTVSITRKTIQIPSYKGGYTFQHSTPITP